VRPPTSTRTGPGRADASDSPESPLSTRDHCSTVASGVRRASTRPTGSATSRRMAKVNASSLARSTHCVSSMATNNRPGAASSRSTSATARPTRPGSGDRGAGSAKPRATSRARRRGSGRPASTATTGGWSNSPVSTANAISRSAGLARHTISLSPRARARSTAHDHKVVFPIPATPSIRMTPGRSASSHDPMASRSASRPTTTVAIAHPPAPVSPDAGRLWGVAGLVWLIDGSGSSGLRVYPIRVRPGTPAGRRGWSPPRAGCPDPPAPGPDRWRAARGRAGSGDTR